jgi:hypothetical protein
MTLSMIGGGGWIIAAFIWAIICMILLMPLFIGLIGTLMYFTGDKKAGAKTMKIFFSIFLAELAAYAVVKTI